MLAWEGARDTRVEITLLAAPAMRRLSRRALGRGGLTDVIAFALPQPDGSVLGDVYICPDAAERWAARGGGTLKDSLTVAGDPKGLPDGRGGRVEEELVRLAVHGTLHVLGYDHPQGARRTRSAMWRRQERYVRRLTGGAARC